MMNGYGYGMNGFGGFWMLIVLGFVIVGVALLVRWLSGQSQRGTTPSATAPSAAVPFNRYDSVALDQQRDHALEIARERLAKGEISPEEFESIKRSLGT